MVALWLIEFTLVALLVATIIWGTQRMSARAMSQARAQNDARRMMRYEEARLLVLRQAHRLVERGVPFEQAVLAALAEDYWTNTFGEDPGAEPLSIKNDIKNDVRRNMTERESKE